MTDWVTVSSLATAGGTLVLASATFASVRSANRAARVAEQSLLAGIRPLLVPSRLEDPEVKVGFVDDHWARVPGGNGTAELDGDVIYLAMSVRNVGNGIAVQHGWRVEMSRDLTSHDHPPVESFRRLTRDLYIAAGDLGFWQGALRDADDPDFDKLAKLIANHERLVVDLLYGDEEGRQRMIGRYSLVPYTSGDGWLATAARHWNVDRPDPR